MIRKKQQQQQEEEYPATRLRQQQHNSEFDQVGDNYILLKSSMASQQQQPNNEVQEETPPEALVMENGGGCEVDEEGVLSSSAVRVPVGETVVSETSTASVERDGRCSVSSFRSYVSSYEFRELMASFVFLILSLVIYAVDPNPHDRPIPYQYLEGSQDYVRNLIFDTTFTTETVSNAMLIVLTTVLPVVLQYVISMIWGKYGDGHKTLCTYFIAIGLTMLATECLKLYVGYMRPYFYQVCEPSNNYQDCTNTDIAAMANIRKSFPSGHASTAFCGLLLLSLYVHNRFGIPSVTVYKQKYVIQSGGGSGSLLPNNNGTNLFRLSACHTTQYPAIYRFISVAALIVPMSGATFIAASRLVDNKHHPADVVGGAVLGGAISVYTNQLWFQ